MKKVIVTGAAGFIGHHLVRDFDRNEVDLFGLDDGRTGNWGQVSSFVKPNYSPMEDLTFREMCDYLDGADVLFHLAAEKYNSSKMTPESVIDVNVRATDLLFRAAVEVGISRIVFTSSLYAYGNLGPKLMSEGDIPLPRTHYGISKLTGEHLLQTACIGSKTSWNIARLLFIYGPEQYADGGYKSVIVTNFERILNGLRPLIKGDGEQALDYVYIDDCKRALMSLADSAVIGKTVNVSNGKAVTVNHLIQEMCLVADIDFEPEYIEADWTNGTSRVGRNDHIREHFGWIPAVDLREGLTRTWNQMKKDKES
jgi:UDP-glucose 4-epimerase